MSNYVHVTFDWRPDADALEVSENYGRPSTAAEKWIVSDDRDVDDGDGPEVTMFATLTSEELVALRSEWSLDPDRAEPALGFLGDLGDGLPRLYADERHQADGMDWNEGGWTPIDYATISIIGPDARPA